MIVIVSAALVALTLILLPLLLPQWVKQHHGGVGKQPIYGPVAAVDAVIPYARVDDAFVVTWRARAAAACKDRPLWDQACDAVLP